MRGVDATERRLILDRTPRAATPEEWAKAQGLVARGLGAIVSEPGESWGTFVPTPIGLVVASVSGEPR